MKATTTLESLATCFQGILPAHLFTCSSDGLPNAAYLSHVEFVDSTHVALSFQFFNKSRRNIAENPNALVLVSDPDSGQGWQLRLRYVRSETAGPLFDRMALRIEAIASYCGLKGIFKLRAADVYEVRTIEPVPEELGIDCARQRIAAGIEPNPIFTVMAMQELLATINRADSLESLVDGILRGLDESFGFRHSAILVPAEEPGVLVTVATRGYADNGSGAEVRFGEGIAGMVAEAQQPIRISGLVRGMLYALAMHRDATAEAEGRPRPRRIAMPGLPNSNSQLGVPIAVRGELIGVLCLESDVPYRFHEEDRATIQLLASYIAIAMQNMQLTERAAEAPDPAPAAPEPAHLGRRREIVYYAADEAIFLDGEYLIRSLPARILWRLLTLHEKSGRVEFTNRELRADKSLNLPQLKDNLESRLLLLRRRLEQKCPDIRIAPRARGRFALELGCDVTLTEA